MRIRKILNTFINNSYIFPFIQSLYLDKTIKIVERNFPNNVSYNIGNEMTFKLRRILFEAGILLTPAVNIYDVRALFPLFKYAGIFSTANDYLRIIPHVENLDSRLKQLLSEEIAIGITGYILRKYCNIVHISDFYPLLNTEVDYQANNLTDERPDYFCLNNSNKSLFCESKGSLGTYASLSKKLIKGKKQVNNVISMNYPLCSSPNRIVIGTHFCISDKHKYSESTTYIEDPQQNENEYNQKNITDNPYRISYSKIFNFAGQPLLANMILTGQKWPDNFISSLNLYDSEPDEYCIIGSSPLGNLICNCHILYKLSLGNEIKLKEIIPKILKSIDYDSEHFIDNREILLLNNGIGLI